MSREEQLVEERLVQECKQKLIEASILFSKLEIFIQENPNCKMTINNDVGYSDFMKTIVDNYYDPNELVRILHKEKDVSLTKQKKRPIKE